MGYIKNCFRVDKEKGKGMVERMNEKKNFQKGMITGVAGGILGCLIVVAIMIVAGVNIFAANNGHITFGQEELPTLETGDEEETTEKPEERGVLTEEFLSKVERIYEDMQSYFLYDIDDKALQDGMLSGMLEALDDPYSCYYNEDELISMMETTQGEYVGIGVSVSQNKKTGLITIVKPYAGAPGAEAGLLPGDVLYKVNDQDITTMELDAVVGLIRGEEGTKVKVTVYREGEPDYLDFEVERRMVEIPTVEFEMLDNQIGYIVVSAFEGNTDEQFETAMETLNEQGMKGLIIDLRDNGGGLLDTVVNMLDYILPEGLIFYVKDKNGNTGGEMYSSEDCHLNVPLVVLVNENSASASEVFAGNIQDFEAGTLVGTVTFGKGIMQSMYYEDPRYSTAIKLTVADYYIHSGRNIHKIGITPDVEVALNEELKQMVTIPHDQDNQLQVGIETLTEAMQAQE